jgi:SAM-dependent methyltransferase
VSPSTKNYDLLADEYYTDRRVTSRNFDDATRSALTRLRFDLTADTYVEIGCGRGRTREFLGLLESGIHVDLSAPMLYHEPRESASGRVRADALSLPIRSRACSLVTSWLLDPYNHPEFYEEVARVLRPDGVLIGSLPTALWGMSARRQLGICDSTTEFVTRKNGVVVVPSLLSTVPEVAERCHSAGLTLLDLAHGFLPPDVRAVSPHVAIAADAFGVSPSDLPLVLVFVAQRGNE